ncbi:MAG: response regulator [Oligoflexia bacterium]|nr:response regulator [Oligoflexia bacterium]
MKKILIVDDSEEFNFLMMSLFKFHNYEVITKTTSEEGCKAIESEKYEVLIVDYLLGDGDNGMDILRKSIESGPNKETPKILLTAKALNDDEKALVSKYEAIYLSKPIMPNDLFRKITELVN